MADKTDIWVYADWVGLEEPTLIGILSAHRSKGKKAFSFEYDNSWLKSKQKFLLDPDIAWFSGPQYPGDKENFGVFLDSMPDTWGRTLMKRREAELAKAEDRKANTLYDIDFLLGVNDQSRMGALRFKVDPEGEFLNSDVNTPTPPWARIRELQASAKSFEDDEDGEDAKKWLQVLIAPGSSLGGARPKANILDDKGHPWIAKFPSKNDTVNKAAWEFLAYKLALRAGVEMSECGTERISGNYDTFFTKRFDRQEERRIHFASAMTMLGLNEDLIRDEQPSYLDILDFIERNGANVEHDLQQLWRRIVFNICISNTDDHLRNHGFLLSDRGWRLSPAFDLNPSTDKDSLALTIDGQSDALDLDLAKSVGEYFRLQEPAMDKIIAEVKNAVSTWEELAGDLGIPRAERLEMASAFRI